MGGAGVESISAGARGRRWAAQGRWRVAREPGEMVSHARSFSRNILMGEGAGEGGKCRGDWYGDFPRARILPGWIDGGKRAKERGEPRGGGT